MVKVGNVKEKIVPEFEKLTKGNVELLITHPMSGSEKHGFDASRAGLFENASWIVVPHKKNKAKINSFIRTFNPKPVQMSASEHDKKLR